MSLGYKLLVVFLAFLAVLAVVIRGTEYCGNPEHHDYELYLAVENIDHTRTKTKSPQTNDLRAVPQDAAR